MSDQPQKSSTESSSSGSSWRSRVVIVAIVLFLAAFAGRWMKEEEGAGAKIDSGLTASAVAVGAKEESFSDKVQKVLPFITEACLALMVGLMAGIMMKSALKFAGILLVLGFIGVQVAIWKGWLPDSIDFSDKLNSLLFVEPTGEGRELAASKAPAAGAGALGLMMGLSKS